MDFSREKYWSRSLFVLILGLGIVIFIEIIPLLGSILGAITLYILLRRQMRYLVIRHKWQNKWAALALICEAILFFLIPFSLLVWFLVNQIQDLWSNSSQIVDLWTHIVAWIHLKTGYDLSASEHLETLFDSVAHAGQWALRNIANFSINIATLPFILYFMLLSGERMEGYLKVLIPFNSQLTRQVMDEIQKIVRANAMIIPLLALLQGLAAYLGYLLFGIPKALFWGLITGCSTIIPLVGAALVWVPLSIYALTQVHWGMGIALLTYGVLIVTQIDNVMRMILQKKMADTHPLITIFGVIIGLSIFGFMGLIFGPLLVAFFLFCVKVFKHTYLDEIPDQAPDRKNK